MVATLVVQKLTHCGSMGVFAAAVPALVAGRCRGPSRIGVRDMLSYESLMPAGAGTPRYEEPELWLGTADWHGGFCYAPPRPQRGTSPRATFSHSAIDHRSTIRRFARGSRLIGGHIPVGVRDNQSAGWCRHTK